jgi:lipopolysaccharide export system protein LptA
VRKQRRLELAVLASAAIFVLVLAFSFRGGRRPKEGGGREAALPPAPEASGQATTLLEGFDFTESVRGKPLMRIRADRTIGYGTAAGLAPNLYSGEKVELTVYPDDSDASAPVTVHSDRADYDERTRESRLSGNVRWTDEDGSLAETGEILFRPRTRMLEAPGRVHFTQGQTSLAAPSARYAIGERILYFAGPIQASGTGSGGGLSKMTGHKGLYRRDSGAIEIENVTGESSSGDRVAADRLLLQMAAEGGRPSWARFEGNVRGILAPGAAGAVPARAAGQPVAAAGADASPPRERLYTADVGTVAFDAEGRTKTVTLEGAPAMLTEGNRRLTAQKIEIGFQDGRAVTASAVGQVRIDSADGHATASRGSLGFGADGVAENMVLEGDVRLESDGRAGDAEKVVELTSKRLWQLIGGPKQSARVTSGGSKLSADSIEIDPDGDVVRGRGRARAVFTPDAQRKVRMTGFVGDPKRPTFGKADLIVLEDAKKTGTLSGSATLWQDDSSLFADDIAMSDADRTVRAAGNVRTVMAPAAPKPGAADARPASVITSKRLLYRDSDRSARFEGGVAITRGGWRASGADSTAWLDEEGGVESVEISGQVKMSDRSTGRSGTADKALDSPKTGKTVLWGSPARVTDAGGNQVAGAVLTIADRGRSVEVTAPEGGKTETIHRTQKN